MSINYTTSTTGMPVSFNVEDATSVHNNGNTFSLYVLNEVLLWLEAVLISPIGVIAGILTLLVLRHFPPSSFVVYLRAIAAADIVRLGNAFTFGQLFNAIDSKWVCRIVYFVAYCSSLTSYTFVAIVSVDRVLAVVIPHKVKAWSTSERAKLIVSIVAILWFCLTIQMMWTYEYNPDFGCVQYSLLSQICNLFYMAVNVGVLIIIFISSVIIIVKLHQQRQLMVKLQIDTSHASIVSMQQKKKDAQISYMLLSITLLYLITTIPYSGVLISNAIMDWALWSQTLGWVYQLSLDVCFILSALNHSLNFLLYCLSAETFRKVAVNVILKCRCRN